MTNPRFRPEPQHEFRTRIKVLTDHGIKMPDEFEALRRRQTDFDNLEQEHPLRDRLIDTVVSDAPTKNAGVAQLFALAVAEGLDLPQTGPIRQAVANACRRRLLQIYAQVAPTVYRQIATEWDDAAAQFSAQAARVDPEMPATEAVTLPEPQRQAWIAVEQAAHRLDELLPVLTTAAALAGVKDTDQDTAVLPLCCDPGQTHRRRMWVEGWDRKGNRCGRWSALRTLGVKVRAYPADQLDTFTPYREPLPKQTRREPTNERGIYRDVVTDPEDNPAAVEPINPRRGAVMA